MNDLFCSQLAVDYCCSKEDVLDPLNHFTSHKFLESRRRFQEDTECFLKIAVINGKILFSGNPEIIDWCIDRKLILQTQFYDSVVFAGYDKNGNIKYAAIRGTRNRFKGDASGSDKRFSFSISVNPESDRLHVFEAAIDLLSFATLQKMNGYDWKEDSMLSLAGVYLNRNGTAPLPRGLSRFLKENPQIHEIHLHLDSDEIGRGASIGLTAALREKYVMVIDPPQEGKDVNDELMAKINKAKREYER